jgi:hypothetical protein
MTTLGQGSPGQVNADRDGRTAIRRRPAAMAEVGSMSTADPLHLESDLLVRAANRARERGLPADAELALWLERSMRRMWAGGSSGAPELAEALAIARALTGDGNDMGRPSRNSAVRSRLQEANPVPGPQRPGMP